MLDNRPDSEVSIHKLCLKRNEVKVSEYRPVIDGLRAVAIIGVILHHYGVTAFPAGYVGVDIFFVISGYLIGGIILNSVSEGNFSFPDFYHRRVIRIFPALLVMLAISTVFAYHFMLPDALRYYGAGVLTAILSLSNVWFYDRINYFNPDTHVEPLIHTWSLGVEEQFYLVLPIMIFLLWRFNRAGLWPILAVATFASFTTMISQSLTNPEAAFYLPFGRFWEFLVGVFAYRLRQPLMEYTGRFMPWLSVAAFIGLVTFMVMNESQVWPNSSTIIPVFCSALLLVFGDSRGLANVILTTRPVVFVGLISYSLYLYHQAVLALARIIVVDESQLLFWPVVGGITLFLSTASWHYIEKPFRNKTVPKFIWKSVLYVIPVVLIFVAFGGHFTKGYPSRLPIEIREIAAFENSHSDSFERCLPVRKDINRIKAADACIHGADVTPTVAIWGDSRAAIVANSLGRELKKVNLAVKELTMSSCTPIVDLYRRELKRGETCLTRNERVFAYLLAHSEITSVVLNSSWAHNLERDWILQPRGGWTTANRPDDYRSLIVERLYKQIIRLTESGKTVVLMYPLPFPEQDPPEAFARLVMDYGDAINQMGKDYSLFLADQKNTFTTLDKLGNIPSLVRIYPHLDFCDKLSNLCLTVDRRQPLYKDAGHLSLVGVDRIISRILTAVTK